MTTFPDKLHSAVGVKIRQISEDSDCCPQFLAQQLHRALSSGCTDFHKQLKRALQNLHCVQGEKRQQLVNVIFLFSKAAKNFEM